MEEDPSLHRYDALEGCKRYALKRPEAQAPEVNLAHPKEEDTWRKISNFIYTTLQRVVRVIHCKGPKIEFSK
jgi:hypothetical protein